MLEPSAHLLLVYVTTVITQIHDMLYIETVTPLLYTLGRLGLEEKTDHLMSLNIMSGTTKRSRLTVFAAALFHWCLYNHAFFQTLYYPSTFPPVQ